MQPVCGTINMHLEGMGLIEPGKNIAIKVPLHRWEETVAFYRDPVGLRLAKQSPDTVAFEFGAMTLWIDRVERQSQVDVWLELFADDPDLELARLGSPKRDELEPLDGVHGHWASDPAGVILLVRRGP
jgi:catechol 2,3-dioxygenase-like lactoylglutathione lyase family enzyme